jgi:alcohol dehydrogenase class IV
MKTLIAVLISLGGGSALGVAAVAGVQASLDPDNGVETANQTINVLDYGDRN